MRTRTTTRALAALSAAVCSLALAACGGADSKAGGDASSGDSAQEAALKFSRCMRENGIDMPDPQTSGSGARESSSEDAFSGINPSDRAFKRAEKECAKHLQGGVGVQSTKPGMEKAGEDPKAEEALLKFARCMREQGIDMPDPRNGTLDLGTAFNPSDPAFQQAQKKCQSEAPLAPPGG